MIILRPNSHKKVRFSNMNSLRRNWGAIILLVGQHSFLLYTSLIFYKDVGALTTTTTCIFVSLFLLLLLLVCILGFLRFPIPIPPQRRIRDIVSNAIFFFLLLFVIWRYVEFFLISPVIVHLADIRLALLIAAIFYLILMLARVPRGNLILDSLIMTRRQLSLGEINLDTARVEADIALTGLRAQDVVEEYVSKLVSLYREASMELKKASYYLDDVAMLYHENQNHIKEQSSLARPLLESLDNSITKADEIVNESIPKTLQPLQTRVFWISSQVEISDTVDDLNHKLGSAREDLLRQLGEVKKKLKTFMDAYNIDPESVSGHQ